MALAGEDATDAPRFLLVAGTTRTAAIDGISAAGASPAATRHTPSADAEILSYGRPVRAPVVPVSPSGCPTPAVVTRAVREHLGFDVTVLDAGLAATTAAPTVDLDAEPGGDVRDPDPVPAADDLVAEARKLGRSLPDERVVVGETIPGGTTTALGVLRALGEDVSVSSSLPENPLELKERVVAEGLDASDADPGDASGEPLVALRRMGDPVLAAVTGLVLGLTESGTDVTLAGGTQLLTAAALVRHAGFEASLSLATTSYVAADESVALHEAAAALDVAVTVTDPDFQARDHPATDAYVAGEAKEGVGMGGALALAERAEVSMAAVRRRVTSLADALLDGEWTDAREPTSGRQPGPEAVER